jgi:hypothetical protein
VRRVSRSNRKQISLLSARRTPQSSAKWPDMGRREVSPCLGFPKGIGSPLAPCGVKAPYGGVSSAQGST